MDAARSRLPKICAAKAQREPSWLRHSASVTDSGPFSLGSCGLRPPGGEGRSTRSAALRQSVKVSRSSPRRSQRRPQEAKTLRTATSSTVNAEAPRTSLAPEPTGSSIQTSGSPRPAASASAAVQAGSFTEAATMPAGTSPMARMAPMEPVLASPPQLLAMARSTAARNAASSAGASTGVRRITCAGLNARMKRGAKDSSSKSTGQRALGVQRAISAR